MGFFSSLASSHFRNDEEGKIIFYPWGATATGYVVTAIDEKERLQRFLQITYTVSVIPALISPFIFGVMLSLGVFLPVFCVWYYFWVQSVTSKMAKSHERLSLVESSERNSKIFALPALIFVELFLLIGFFCSVVLLILGQQVLFAIIAFVFLGINVCGVGYMILKKIKN